MQEMFAKVDCDAIDAYAGLIAEAWNEDRQVFVFGNGGTSYIASHHVTDYIKTAAIDGQRRLRALSMLDNMGITTAVSNDISYDDAFLYPLQTYARPGDLAVGISCSGTSMNVVNALAWAKDNGLKTVAMSGFSGGKIADIADLHINVPTDNYGVIEDIHMSIGHIATHMLHNHVESVKK